MGKAPAFQMYASDFYVDTNTWTIEEVGIYTRLLLSQWVNGSLPDDMVRLARASGCSTKKFQKSWQSIQIKFQLNGNGHFQNLRLEEERQKQLKYRELQSQKGKLSALKRSTVVETVVEPELQPKVNSSSSSSSSSSLKKEKNILSDEDFLTSLKEKFTWIDFDVEMVKIDAWLLANPRRKKTRRFIVRWISKIEKPMGIDKTECFLNENNIWQCKRCGRLFTLKENMEKHTHKW